MRAENGSGGHLKRPERDNLCEAFSVGFEYRPHDREPDRDLPVGLSLKQEAKVVAFIRSEIQPGTDVYSGEPQVESVQCRVEPALERIPDDSFEVGFRHVGIFKNCRNRFGMLLTRRSPQS